MSESAIMQLDRRNDEVVEALHSAIEVLSVEFSETEGSGHDALVKCQNALNTLTS